MALKDYLSVVFSLLDIPLYEHSYKESLHILFTLFSEFKQNPHFKLIDAKEMFPANSGDANNNTSSVSASSANSSLK